MSKCKKQLDATAATLATLDAVERLHMVEAGEAVPYDPQQMAEYERRRYLAHLETLKGD